jgi:hypothetical protein
MSMSKEGSGVERGTEVIISTAEALMIDLPAPRVEVSARVIFRPEKANESGTGAFRSRRVTGQ